MGRHTDSDDDKNDGRKGAEALSAAPELLIDGSFETAGVRNNSWSHFASVGGWKSDTGVEVWGKNFYGLKATDGNNIAELDFDRRASSIYQDVQTEAGAEYTFSFDYMKRPDSKAGSDSINVFWNGELVGTVDPANSFWEKASFTVKGTGGNDRIEFRESGEDNDSYGGLIDNASLKRSVPPPAQEDRDEQNGKGDDHHDGRGHGDGDHNDDGHSDNGRDHDEDDRDRDNEDDDHQGDDRDTDDDHEEDDHHDGDAKDNDHSEGGDQEGGDNDEGDGDTPPVEANLILNVSDVGEVITDETMQGGTDDDSFVGGVGNDKLFGNKGNDKLVGDDMGLLRSPLTISATLTGAADPMAVSYLISGMPEGAELSAGTRNADGTWTLSASDVQGLEIRYSDAANFSLHVTASTTDGSGLQAEGDIYVTLQNGHDDHIEGGGGNDTINGDAGDDVIYGGSAPTGLSTPHVDAPEDNNVISGGDGNDKIWGNSGDDLIDGNTGNDTILGGKGNDTINGGEDNDTISGNTGNDLISGNDGDDLLKGNAGNDQLSDGLGNDVVEGSSGDDVVDAGEGNDSYNGGSGFDTIDFSGAADGMTIDLSKKSATGMGQDVVWNFEQVIGSGFDDVMKGSKAAETLVGGSGNDTLRSLGGADTLTGGAGSDTFAFSASDVVSPTKHLGIDRITDFSLEDTLDFSELLKGQNWTSIEDVLQVNTVGNDAMVSARVGGQWVEVVALDGFAGHTAGDMLKDGLILA